MSDDAGADIIGAVRNVRRFLEDVGKLLATVSEYLKSKGWSPRPSNYTAVTISQSLTSPSNWLPQDAFWFTFNSQFPNYLLVVSVIFDSIDSPALFKLPIVMSGYVCFKQPPGENWQYKLSRLCDQINAPPDGEFREVSPAYLSRIAGAERAEIAVTPLTLLTSSEVLQRNVLDPLLLKVQNRP